MSVFPCSMHGRKVQGRMASLYSAWFLADGSRTAWKQRLCVDCVRERLKELLAHALDSPEDVTVCPACGSESSKDLDPIYLTLYLPKSEPREYALTTDAGCAAGLRQLLQERAEKLADRNFGSNGTSGGTNVSEWDDAL